MSDLGNNFNSISFIKHIGNQAKNALNKLNPNANQNSQKADNPKQNPPNQSLANTNSNININQQTQSSGVTTQGALNATNKPMQSTQISESIKSTTDKSLNPQIDKASPNSASDLPKYASIPNMSMKSWASDQQGRSYINFDATNKDLRSTLQGIKGFESSDSNDSEGDANEGGRNKDGRKRSILLLSYIFSQQGKGFLSNSETLARIVNFNKLGTVKGDVAAFLPGKVSSDKNSPPPPTESASLENLSIKDLRFLRELIALPKEFPEGVRLFAKEGIDIRADYLRNFLEHRFEVVQSQIFNGGDPEVAKLVAEFTPLLNQGGNLLLPFILLYYPLPLPYINRNFDFEKEWEKEKRNEPPEGFIATCDIYYTSKYLGRFLFHFELDKNENFNFDIQAEERNECYIKQLEESVSEIMFLLQDPPSLSDFNVLLTQEIYEATDINEELAIVSTGPLRLEILLATYAVLFTLNRIQDEPTPTGIIDLE